MCQHLPPTGKQSLTQADLRSNRLRGLIRVELHEPAQRLKVLFGQLGIPMEAMTFVLAVNPILDMFDTMNNTTGDMTAALIVAKSEKLLDTEVYYK